MIDNRITTTSFTILGGTISDTPMTIQLANAVPQTCFTVAALENNMVDGPAFYTVNLALAGTTVAQNIPVFIGTENATIQILDDECKSN